MIASLLMVSMTLQMPSMSPMGARVVTRAAAYAPRDLMPLFQTFEEDFKRGLAWQGARPTAERLDQDIAALIQRVRKHEAMPVIIEELAALTQKTLLYMDPVQDGSGDPLAAYIHRDFPRFVQSRLPKFPVIFYGFDPQLHRGDTLSYFRNQTRDQKDLCRLLIMDYTRGGAWATHQAFDDQSNAFGVAQISMNQAFSAVLNLWYYIWTKSGGRWGPLKPVLNTEKVWLIGYGY